VIRGAGITGSWLIAAALSAARYLDLYTKKAIIVLVYVCGKTMVGIIGKMNRGGSIHEDISRVGFG